MYICARLRIPSSLCCLTGSSPCMRPYKCTRPFPLGHVGTHAWTLVALGTNTLHPESEVAALLQRPRAPSAGRHRCVCGDTPWCHWCSGGGRLRLAPREGGHPNFASRPWPGLLDSRLPTCWAPVHRGTPLASWPQPRHVLTQLGRRLAATQLCTSRGRGLPGVGKGSDISRAWKRQAPVKAIGCSWRQF